MITPSMADKLVFTGIGLFLGIIIGVPIGAVVVTADEHRNDPSTTPVFTHPAATTFREPPAAPTVPNGEDLGTPPPVEQSGPPWHSPAPGQMWSCVDDGDHVCAPGNDQHAPAGCYDTGGVLVAPWPCHVVIDTDGNGSVYAGASGLMR